MLASDFTTEHPGTLLAPTNGAFHRLADRIGADNLTDMLKVRRDVFDDVTLILL